MLDEMAKVGSGRYESIVSWQPHGKAFRVHQPDAFSGTVMPRYFHKQTKYKSFLRQLHIYGFRRIRKGKDSGAYYHSMFIRNNKSMSLQMSCQRIKGINKTSSNAEARQQHRRAATVDPDFYSLETDVDKDQNQDRRNLTNVLQVEDPMMQQASSSTIKKEKRGCSSKVGPARVYTCGSSDYQPDEEKRAALVNCDHLFNQEDSEGGPSQSHQLIDSEIGLLVDWMEQARPRTILSRDEQGLASPYHVHDASPAHKKCHDVSALLHGWDDQKDGDEGFFAGKRFFCVAETNMPIVEKISAVINGGGPMFCIPRSA
jgi:hypothetical protein